MKFTFSWLLDHLDTSHSLEDLADALMGLGFEVEGIEDRRDALAPFRVARVRTVSPHPNADRLRVCEVETVEGIFEVVCGAPNVRLGMSTIFAPLGSVIPSTGVTLQKGVIRGVTSFGMLCSAQELGVSEDGEGILDLGEGWEIGTPASEALGLGDPVLEIKVTPNRGDGLGVRGLARDLAAKGMGTLKPLVIPAPTATHRSSFSITRDCKAEEACPYFTGCVITGVRNGPSPPWLARRLSAVGLKPISALVDITNYLCRDLGRPLHVFDLDRLEGGLEIRLAKAGEPFSGLGGRSCVLEEGMLVIADDRGVQAVAGILGGEYSGARLETTSLFLESAWFDPVSIAQTGRKLGLHSDARHRFERGVDPGFVRDGLNRAIGLILEICGGQCAETSEVGAPPDHRRTYRLEVGACKKLLGYDVPRHDQITTLQKLGFSVLEDGEALQVTPPTWRLDILGTPDLVEEICRCQGLEKVPMVPLARSDALTRPVLSSAQVRVGWARRVLAVRGLHEVVTWSFLSQGAASLFGGGGEELRVINPISSALSDMRPSLFPNLLSALQKNSDRGFSNVSLFEVGQVYFGRRPEEEKLHGAGVRMGDMRPRGFREPRRGVDLYDAKSDLFAVLEELGLQRGRLQVQAGGPSWYHPGRVGTVSLGPRLVLGTFGELHPRICEFFGISGPVCGFHCDLSAFPETRRARRRAPFCPSDLMEVRRDFAFLVEASQEADVVVRAIEGVDRTLITAVRVFDVFFMETSEGERPKKSLGLEVVFSPQERTLTEAELAGLSQQIISAVQHKTGGVLR